MHFRSTVTEIVLAVLVIVFYFWELPNGLSSWVILISALLIIFHAATHMKSDDVWKKRVTSRARRKRK